MAGRVRKGIKISGACLFGIYVAGLVYFLFFAESYGRGMESAAYSCNFRPFREIRRYLIYWEVLGRRTVFLNLAGNIIGFIPFGALLPLMAKGVRKAWRVTLLGFEVSAVIEVSQLIFRVGCFDVDDMILNTLGALAGYLIYVASSRCYHCFERRCRNRRQKKRR